MANRSVVVNFVANTSAYVAGVAKATGATSALGGAATMALARIAGPTALVYGLSQAAKTSLAFTDEMTKLKTQIGLTNPEIADMRRAALGLGGATTKGPQELAEATFFIASAGLRGAAAMDVLRSSAQLSAIGLGETKTIADLLTSAVNAYGEESLSAAAASDALVSAVRLGKLEADQLAGAMGRVLPIASAMGVSFEEVGGFMAAMSKTGTDASTAATQLRAIMVSLLKPSNQSSEALHDFGLTAEGLRATILEDGLWAALMQLHEATDGNADAFAEIFPNVRALAGVMDLLGPQLEGNAALMAEMGQSTGVAAEAFAEFSTGTRAELQRMGAAFQRTGIIIGTSTQGPIARGARVITSALTGAANAVGVMGDRAAFTQMALGDYADALADLRRMTEGVSGAQLQAVMDSAAYEAALRRVRDSAQAARGVEHELGFEVERRGFLTRDANKFDEESIRLLELRVRVTQANLDPMRGMNALADRYTGLAAKYTGAVEGQTSALDDLADSLGFTREEMDLLTRSIDEQRRARLALIDPVYAAVEAERRYREALEEVVRVQGDAEASSDDLLDAVFEMMFAEIERQAAMENAGLVTEGFIGTLDATIEALGLTETQADRVRERLGELGIAMDTLDGRVVSPVVDVKLNLPALPAGLSWGSGGLPMIPGGTVSMPQMPVPNIPGRARGGPISAGQPYIVGEEGPELIIPSGSGRVMSAPQTQGMMGGATYNVTVNMPPGADGDQVVSALRRWERSNGPIPVGVR